MSDNGQLRSYNIVDLSFVDADLLKKEMEYEQLKFVEKLALVRLDASIATVENCMKQSKNYKPNM